MPSGLPVCATWAEGLNTRTCVQWLGCPESVGGEVGEVCGSAYLGSIGLLSERVTVEDFQAIAPGLGVLLGVVFVARVLFKHFE
jgi:hypothetical protein